MKNNRRRVLLGGLLLAIATVSVAATVDHWLFFLPPPQECNRQQLMRWVVQRYLQEEPDELQKELIECLGRELDNGIDFQSVSEQLDAAMHQQLQANADFLLPIWLTQVAKEYQVTSNDNRRELLDGLIDRVESWKVLDYLAKSGSDGPSASSPVGAGARLQIARSYDARMKTWIDDSPAEERETLRTFLHAVRIRILMRALGR